MNLKATHSTPLVTVLDFTYSFVSGSISDGQVKSVTNNLATGRSQTYTYDEMNRLATAQSQANSGADCWGLGYGYDRYANLLLASVTKCSAPALSLSVDAYTNKITNSGFTYDTEGNLTADGSYTYTWNAEGRMASAAGVSYTYDGGWAAGEEVGRKTVLVWGEGGSAGRERFIGQCHVRIHFL